MKTVLAAFILIAASSAAAAQSVTIVATPAAPPTPDQAKECIAIHWIGARNAASPAGPAATADRNAAVAWVNWLASTTGLTQVQLQPDVRAATDRLTVNLTDPAQPDARAPLLTRCAAFERVAAPTEVAAKPASDPNADPESQGEEGADPPDDPVDAPVDDGSTPTDSPDAPPT